MDALPRQQRRLARGEELARHVDADVARVGEVEHRREQRRARDAAVAARGEHRERAREQRAADAEAERVDRPAAGDFACATRDGGEHALLEVVVPA